MDYYKIKLNLIINIPKPKLLLAIWLEKLHRYVFDNIYVHSYYSNKLGFTIKEETILFIYNTLFKMYPTFRLVLRRTGKSKYIRYSLPQL